MRCSLVVNGTPVEYEVEPRELLAEILRDRTGLTGTKIACDTAQCGSCVVELNGRTVKSCQVLAVSATGSTIVTVEGVSPATAPLTDLQNALRDAHAVQCGFCTPGLVMNLRELTAQTPQPTADEVREALDGTFCRCTGYVAVVDAVAVPAGDLR